MAASSLEAALPFALWARVWSPLSPDAWREEAWAALELPAAWPACESDFLGAFVVGWPAPDVPLLLHAALGRDGGAVREEWMRVIAHLGLHLGDRALPPDHLGAACEVLACAIEREETLLVRELLKRYFEPWCEVALSRLSGRHDDLARLPACFAGDLGAVASRLSGSPREWPPATSSGPARACDAAE
jgi:hypothetical protein